MSWELSVSLSSFSRGGILRLCRVNNLLYLPSEYEEPSVLFFLSKVSCYLFPYSEVYNLFLQHVCTFIVDIFNRINLWLTVLSYNQILFFWQLLFFYEWVYFQAYVNKLTGFVCPAAFIPYVYNGASLFLSWYFHIHLMTVVNL